MHDISILQMNVIAKAETVRSKEVSVDVSRSTVGLELEMMVLNILVSLGT
ncbi:MAG: hypothetical protein WAN18_04175 [Candidatus Sulfotelmatobacter sp.]